MDRVLHDKRLIHRNPILMSQETLERVLSRGHFIIFAFRNKNSPNLIPTDPGVQNVAIIRHEND
jgi:hypothetical protein